MVGLGKEPREFASYVSLISQYNYIDFHLDEIITREEPSFSYVWYRILSMPQKMLVLQMFIEEFFVLWFHGFLKCESHQTIALFPKTESRLTMAWSSFGREK